MFSLFHLLLLLLLFFSTNMNSLDANSTSEGRNSGNAYLPIDTVFKFWYPIPAWPAGGSFANGAIDLGGLLVKPISSFSKIWKTYQFGPHEDGATFFEPSSIPDGFFMLGSYAQSNGDLLFGSVLVAKDLIPGVLLPPIDYELVWSSEPSNTTRDGNGYIWRPIPPAGFGSVGHLVTTSPEKPPLEKIRCVKSDFTDSSENDNYIWRDEGIQIHGLKPSIRGTQAQGLSPGTFNAEHNPGNFVSCLKNIKNDLSSMPNLDQINALIKAYSPWVTFHPDEEFLPSSVSWFWKNGAVLYKKGDESNPVKVEPTGLNLPMNGPNDGSYWLDLPKDEFEKKRVQIGDLQDASGYFHIKSMFGGTYTDIVVWIFYPFNGNSKADILSIVIKLGKIGEHVGDWEHITLRISNFDGELKSVYLSQHKSGEWIPVNRLKYKDGNKPVVYACLHSHAHESFPVSKIYGGYDSIGILAEAEESDLVLDTGARFLIIAAEYLGPSFVEAPWLNYANEWGPKIDYEGIKDQIKKLRDALPFFLQDDFDRLISKLPDEFLGQEGPLGPKMKDSWNGDEDI